MPALATGHHQLLPREILLRGFITKPSRLLKPGHGLLFIHCDAFPGGVHRALVIQRTGISLLRRLAILSHRFFIIAQ
jgi:hypothetical protein